MAKFNKDEWIVIGISGVTCGGKTTLANRIKEAVVPVYVFHQDKYFYPDDSPKHIKCPSMDHNNYDILSALDMEKMFQDIIDTLNGRDKSHANNLARTAGKKEIKGKKFLIAEGFTALNYKPIMDICNLRYYLVLEYEACASRRVFRLYDPPDAPGYFERCVWPEHLKYRAEIEKDRRVTLLDGTIPDVFTHVLNDVISLGAVDVAD
ncbi:nicotinamide riboside kinase 1 isoform X2 [Plodia interpunctella]|uniref:nicotinamide riboside kinase 1 isoform X2 n=1 Tax=Plodia interpunctella TaxID=58824 RepID=UPI00236851D4|nr:nicotinamide riboside kinase 1 isoform X2 [Plodia interpunctella]